MPMPVDDPTIAVIVTAHNAERTLHATLGSVLAQTVAPSEIIVVDDGSTDQTARIAAETAPGARILHQPRAGAAAARNAGADAATSEWLAFLDADDLWPPDRTRALAEACRRRPDIALVHGRVAIRAEPGTRMDARMQQADGTHIPYLIGSLLIRRSVWTALGGMSTAHEHGEDTDLYLRFRHAGFEIAAIDDVTLIYVQHGSNQSRDVERSSTALLTAMRAAIERRKRGSSPAENEEEQP